MAQEIVNLHLDENYLNFINEVKTKLKNAQLRASMAVSNHILSFYHNLGTSILQMEAEKKHWGSKFLNQLSHDIQLFRPGASGYSRRSLEYMRLLAMCYPDESAFTQQAAAQLPWAHVQILLDKFKNDSTQREWYAQNVIKYGWSRSTMNMHIKSNLFERQGIYSNKVSNYKQILASPQSDLAHEMLKNPYSFDFLTISESASEKEIENALASHIKDFLLELGTGFAFVGTQVPIEVDGEEYFIDVLFYHLKLRSYVVCELKSKKFKPADLGQIGFYLTAVDRIMRHAHDNPTIGILLCESRSKIVAEYALESFNSPVGISEYTLSKSLPKNLKSNLPTIAEIENELNASLKNDKKVGN